MSGPDWYRWYPAKWASGVIGLTLEQRSVYFDIINIILDRGECPEDYKYLSKACNCRVPRVRRIAQELINLGKLSRVSGALRQDKAHNERINSEQFARLQAQRAHNRWSKSSENNSLADAISGTPISGTAITTTVVRDSEAPKGRRRLSDSESQKEPPAHPRDGDGSAAPKSRSPPPTAPPEPEPDDIPFEKPSK
jgi:hypothetical protein